MAKALSLIIPTLNDAEALGLLLAQLQIHRAEVELIVVDGHSQDTSIAIATPLADHVLCSPAGRARQMNAGAAHAQGETLLFVHADTQLPDNFPALISHAMQHADWGRFDLRLQPSTALLRCVAWFINTRSRLTRIATGDQGIFVRRRLWQQLGGYADIALMEDIELSRRLKRAGQFAAIRTPLITSSRRWLKHGTLRTIGLMWSLRWRYWRGADPADLAARYYGPRQS
ncbi:TIGR04283 family arsenosugar biosynthesis glycosyltransferase [Atopomonas sediminilitoris]|uniref:TIGR04283 family arsenosugar biosynthesis glycosyltransferase n=1 Tax=Atopomonas sediminilitoris TaxID=2919919 RepID=UPI001F4F01A1|nr:TIGR04283 family arsenosugar biosynthesis glycosyltransferase [Atopomonas sediminilitoris]MCJ8169337.1 TIGR04283 family arsenosugar biosynthesis glycosyltransferase [Atopomonas sediminilitoris]